MNKYLVKVSMRADVKRLLGIVAKKAPSDAKGLIRKSLDSAYPKTKLDIDKLRKAEGTHTDTKRTFSGWKYDAKGLSHYKTRDPWVKHIRGQIKETLKNEPSKISPRSDLSKVQTARIKGMSKK